MQARPPMETPPIACLPGMAHGGYPAVEREGDGVFDLRVDWVFLADGMSGRGAFPHVADLRNGVLNPHSGSPHLCLLRAYALSL